MNNLTASLIGTPTKLAPPSVSVILPVHNGERFLDEAIASVLSQTFRGFELIIVENASTDRSYGIARRWAAQDDRVVVIQSNEPGAATAINLGIHHARANWFARMDADDVWLPEKLERQWDFIQNNPDVGVVGTSGWIIGETGKRMGVFRAGPTTRDEFQRKRQENKMIYLLSPSVMFSRAAVETTSGHDQSYAPAEDVEYWTRLSDHVEVRALVEQLVLYRIHASASSTRSFFRQCINAQRATENASRRRQGVPEFSWEEYGELRACRPLRVKLSERLSWQSQYYYRRGGGLLVSGRPSGVAFLAASFVLNPILPIRRLKRQRVWSVLVRYQRS